MPIKTLIHNLKLLGFDESKHGKGAIKLNDKLFTHEAINNDKALEYICLFLFRKVDKFRVKKELLPTLTTHTYAGRQHFITHVYKWLVELRQKTHLLNSVPLRKSELSANQGANLIKIIVAFTTFVLENTIKHTDVGKISTMSKAAIQNSIVQENQTFDLNTQISNTYISKATKAAKEISAELSSSPPPPPPPSENTIPVESQSIRRLNDHLQSILHSLHTIVPDAASQESDIVEEPSTSAPYEQLNAIERSSSSLSFESLRALEESSTSFIAEHPKVVDAPLSPVISGDAEAVSEPTTTVSIEQSSTVEESSIPVVFDHLDTMNAPSSTILAEQSGRIEEPTSSDHVEESTAVVTSPNTSVFYSAESSIPAEESTFNSTTIKSASPELDSAEPEVLNIDLPKAKGSTSNMYMPEGSRMITTPNYIPQSLAPNDEQRDVPNAPRKIAQPKPRATTPNTKFTPQHTNFASRNEIHYPPISSVLPPMRFSYATESSQLPPLRHIILAYSHSPLLDSPYWHLPSISHHTPSVPIASPRTPSASPRSPSSAPKRKSDEQEGQDNIVVPPSPPPQPQRRRLTFGGYEGGTTPTRFDMELVPPLMEEAAPFRRIYNTDFFDIDFMTPRR